MIIVRSDAVGHFLSSLSGFSPSVSFSLALWILMLDILVSRLFSTSGLEVQSGFPDYKTCHPCACKIVGVQELCESRGGPPNEPCGFCGRKI